MTARNIISGILWTTLFLAAASIESIPAQWVDSIPVVVCILIWICPFAWVIARYR